MNTICTRINLLLCLMVATLCCGTVYGQGEKKTKKKVGAFYASWGYNSEQYTQSTLHVKQSGLGNDYKLMNVRAHDHKGWDEGVFNMALTIPQYNYRLGYFFNEKQNLAIEINFDHTKYIMTNNQTMRIKGILNHAAIDDVLKFSSDSGFYYFLNNGANFLLFNLVQREGIYHSKDRNLNVDFLGKAGIGPLIPHVENKLFGKLNDQGFQIGGWNAGLEAAIRVTIMKYAYLEFAQKLDYARYSNLRVYQGRASQAFGTYETILSLGITLPTSKNNPLFTPVAKKATANTGM